ncbi:MAG: hypothetical protein EXR98_15295 [Gemmataceae bacterium]|nr:hypothetical protein [Gemmataceae bacterium]
MLAIKEPETYVSPLGDDSIVELSLMMSRRQFEAMDEQACARGMSVAQFLRRLVQKSIEQDSADIRSN